MPIVLVETVGVGQVEVEIADAADTTIVVVNPGWGDSVQASKAGLLEVADVFAVNKADWPGAAGTARDLVNMMDDVSPRTGGWRPPVLLTTSTTGEGLPELWAAVKRHREFLVSGGELAGRREQRLVDELGRVLTSRIEQDVKRMKGGAVYESVKADLIARSVDPYDAADLLLNGRPEREVAAE
jgi:LAO/AO transport system kinase